MSRGSCSGWRTRLGSLLGRMRRTAVSRASRWARRRAIEVFVCGYPAEVGRANTELWHTVRLWRRMGLGVTLIPTWQADPQWQARLDQIGCRTVEASPDDLQGVPGLAGSIVVAMCNTRFLAVAERFRELGCRIVWLGCMNWLFPKERLHYRRHGPFDCHVFQSRHQRDELEPQLRRYGYDERQGRLIRGAIDLDEFPFVPNAQLGEIGVFLEIADDDVLDLAAELFDGISD